MEVHKLNSYSKTEGRVIIVFNAPSFYFDLLLSSRALIVAFSFITLFDQFQLDFEAQSSTITNNVVV